MQTYFICGTARSGTTLIADLLHQTGIAGDPREWFNHYGGRSWFGWDYSDYERFVEKVIRETSSENGVFGSKLMGATVPRLLHNLRTIDGNQHKSTSELFQDTFGDITFIHIYRRDKLRQAISHEKMLQSGVAHQRGNTTDSSPRPKLKYKYYRITRTLAELAYRETFLQDLYQACAVKPLTLVYEDYIHDQEATVRLILDTIGIALPDDYVFQPSEMRKMADAVTDDWVQRFQADRDNRWKRKLFG